MRWTQSAWPLTRLFSVKLELLGAQPEQLGPLLMTMTTSRRVVQSWRPWHQPPPDGACRVHMAACPDQAPTTSGMLGIPAVLVQQRDRDLEGHGISLRSVAEASWARTALDDKRGMHVHRTELMRACTQLAVSFDRLLGDGQRCEAYCAAIDGALAAGAHTFAFLGTGSLLPALHAAHNGGRVVMVEPCEPLAQLASAAAAENELR